ncbi:T9SS type A sorting domain-containing protein [Aquimarina addita]|uniref:T9SS type A sorting domain-containing protein n=1 Tax=Aquimarina addita TaxID=870485 RepID=A0ABP6UZF5_9FLAO
MNLDDTLKQLLLTQVYPSIDVNRDGEIQVSEALNTTSINIYNIDQNNQDQLYLFGLNEFKNLENLSIYEYDIIGFDVSDFEALRALDLYKCNLESIDISENQNLTNLTLLSNSLSSIDVSQNTNLVNLNLSNNNLTSIDVFNLNTLEVLDLRYNDNMETIDVSNNLKLTKLLFDRSIITDLDVTQNTDLVELQFGNSDLSSIDLTKNLELEKLNIYGNEFTEIDISNNTNIVELSVSSNNLTEIDLSPLKLLEKVWLRDNDFESVDFSMNSELKYIYLSSNNSLTNIDISKNPKLEWLNLISTALEHIDVSDKSLLRYLIFWGSPNLRTVNMKNGNNVNFSSGAVNIRDLPLLETICVDDIAYAQETFTVEDVEFNYIDDCNASQENTISGTINFDLNNTNCSNSNPLENILIEVSSGDKKYSTLSKNNGAYSIGIPNIGDLIVSIVGGLGDEHIVPNNETVIFTEFGNTEIVDFCIEAQPKDDLSIKILPIDEVRPGFTARYDIVYENNGTSVTNGKITLEFDQNLQNIELVEPNYSSLVGNKITWNFFDLQAYQTNTIHIDFIVTAPPTVNGDDILTYTANVSSTKADETPNDNSFTLEQLVVNSFDPNDKRVLQGTSIYIDETNEYLDYIVRFQNTGTASAINVIIEDILDANLDWNTFQMVSASHDYILKITDGNKIEFIFENINLPDSTTDEQGSNGYVSFKIKPKDIVVLGDIIEGSANIYFDFNLPIVTNLVSTQIIERPVLSVRENFVTENTFKLFPIPITDNKLHIKNDLDFEVLKSSFIMLSGKVLDCIPISSSKSEIVLDTFHISSNLFFLKLETNNGVFIKKVINKR